MALDLMDKLIKSKVERNFMKNLKSKGFTLLLIIVICIRYFSCSCVPRMSQSIMAGEEAAEQNSTPVSAIEIQASDEAVRNSTKNIHIIHSML